MFVEFPFVGTRSNSLHNDKIRFEYIVGARIYYLLLRVSSFMNMTYDYYTHPHYSQVWCVLWSWVQRRKPSRRFCVSIRICLIANSVRVIKITLKWRSHSCTSYFKCNSNHRTLDKYKSLFCLRFYFNEIRYRTCSLVKWRAHFTSCN